MRPSSCKADVSYQNPWVPTRDDSVPQSLIVDSHGSFWDRFSVALDDDEVGSLRGFIELFHRSTQPKVEPSARKWKGSGAAVDH